MSFRRRLLGGNFTRQLDVNVPASSRFAAPTRIRGDSVVARGLGVASVSALAGGESERARE